MDGINALHTDFVVNKVLVDQRINGYFLNDDVDGGNLIGCLDKQIGEAAGCEGVVYDCLDMVTAHQGLGISTVDFGDLAEDYSAALDDHQAGLAPNLTDQDKMDIIGILASMAPDIVEDPDNNLTVYQRVGRKPAILGLIGKPGEVDSFVDNVANDAEVNGFFGATNFDRLNTCLTRQVSSIDGPIKYGQEVDAPPMIDEGVNAMAKCLDMCTSHGGLVDDMDMPITINDFGALVTDLVTAMDTAGVAQEDKDALLAALGPLCPQIVADPFSCMFNTQDLVLESLGVNTEIPDNAYNGALDSMLCVDLEVMDDGDGFDTVANASLELGVMHPWVGDLTIKVEAPDGTVFAAMSRPTLPEAADDGTDCCGDSSDLAPGNPVTFVDGGMFDAEQMGGTLGNMQVVCLNDNQCEFFPNKGSAISADEFGMAFGGKGSIGTWRVCIGDSGTGDVGQLVDVRLTLNETDAQFCP